MVSNFYDLSFKKFILYVDERQVNVNYSVCNGLKFNSQGLCEKILIYNVYCQYGVHFKDQLQDVS